MAPELQSRGTLLRRFLRFLNLVRVGLRVQSEVLMEWVELTFLDTKCIMNAKYMRVLLQRLEYSMVKCFGRRLIRTLN